MLYIVRASSEGVCHCQCEDAPMSVPDQLDCPWCGCGWMLTCSRCNRAYTFGVARHVPGTLREIILNDFRQRQLPKELLEDKEFIDGCVESISEMIENIEEGEQYVYFDGILIPVDYDDRIEFEGLHATHDLATLPHLDLREDPDAARHLLGDPRYWTDRQHEVDPDDEDDEDSEDDSEYEDDDFEDDEDDVEGPEDGPDGAPRGG